MATTPSTPMACSSTTTDYGHVGSSGLFRLSASATGPRSSGRGLARERDRARAAESEESSELPKVRNNHDLESEESSGMTRRRKSSRHADRYQIVMIGVNYNDSITHRAPHLTRNDTPGIPGLDNPGHRVPSRIRTRAGVRMRPDMTHRKTRRETPPNCWGVVSRLGDELGELVNL